MSEMNPVVIAHSLGREEALKRIKGLPEALVALYLKDLKELLAEFIGPGHTVDEALEALEKCGNVQLYDRGDHVTGVTKVEPTADGFIATFTTIKGCEYVPVITVKVTDTEVRITSNDIPPQVISFRPHLEEKIRQETTKLFSLS